MMTLLAYGVDWKMGKAPLMTSFASTIDTSNVLGEYPRPQMVRENWMNLNGIWQFQPGTGFSQTLPTGTLSQKILVPFPVESAISGVMTHYDNLWYRRTFTIPAEWAGQRILVHFGAVDYESEVYINGQAVGIHIGGYDPFTYDITSKLKDSGLQEIDVKVNDPTNGGGQPRGKQSLTPGGIMYTACSGIWQPVWLEPVPQTSISDLKIVPDLDNSSVVIKAVTLGNDSSLTVRVEVKDGANTVAQLTGIANSNLRIPVTNPKLWSPNSPFLYNLKITLMSGNTPIDSLGSYFGMRKISMKQVGNVQKLFLNNEPIFQFGPLDQGYWPDGVYTAPTDSAMLFDLQNIKAFGYNMVRKHIKVEPYRWYYYADKLGLLVWQDMPSSNSYTGSPQTINTTQFKSELEKLVQTHWNSPSIVMWVVFNESQGQHDTPALVSDVMSLDSTRLVNQASGGDYFGVGNILDMHSYPGPGCPVSTTQALTCGEFGSIGLNVPNHLWGTGLSFIMVNTEDDLMNTYQDYAKSLMQFKSYNGLSAAVFTQITDVEVEVNGIYTYDRAVCKMDKATLLETNQNVINKNLIITEVLPSSLETGRSWKYTTSQPTSTWYGTTFNDTGWKSGLGGFGSTGMTGGNVRTSWTSSDIWIRQQFDPGSLSAADIDTLELYVFHDEDCEIYFNGVLASTLSGFNTGYQFFPINAAGKNAIIPNGSNVIAIHCHQTTGGQYIDAGISERSYEVSSSTGIANVTTENKCKLYPNPASTELSVLRESPQTELIGIYNILGRKVLQLDKFDSQVNISALSPGMYFMETETDRVIQNISFIKN
jgi:hypothetical protein